MKIAKKLYRLELVEIYKCKNYRNSHIFKDQIDFYYSDLFDIFK